MSGTENPLLRGLDPAGLFDIASGSAESTAHWTPPTVAEAAALFPAWKVLRLLGRGGMGAVYLVHQPDLDRHVAVKLLPLEASLDEARVERFRREARTLAKLKHPGIVSLFESGTTPAGHLFFVMEYVEGCPLDDLIASSKVSVPQALEIVGKVCEALAFAHAAGVVHRDIKPSNILIDATGNPRVADFGLARLELPSEDAQTLSRTGMFMGTEAYAAPEQMKDAARADHRADIYSLGVLLYEMLTGEIPRGIFQPPSRKAGTDTRLDGVVQRALQERPEDRYQAATDLGRDVSTLTAPAAAKRSALPWLIAALGAGAAAAVALWPKADTPSTTSPNAAAGSPPSAEKAASQPAAPAQGTAPSASPVHTPPQPPASPAVPAPQGVKFWSFNPLPSAAYPPASVTGQPWKDAALLQDGGAALYADGSFSQWKPGVSEPVRSLRLQHPFTAMTGAGDHLVALDARGNLLLIHPGEPSVETGSAPATLFARETATLYPGNGAPFAGALTTSGTAVLWSIPGCVMTELPAECRNARHLSVSHDGHLFVVTESGALLRRDSPESGDFVKVAPGSSDLPASGPLRQFHGGDGYSLAVQQDGRMVIWGQRVPDSQQRVRLSQPTAVLRVNASGTIAEWVP